MQEKNRSRRPDKNRLPHNCEFNLEITDVPDWYRSYQGMDFIHIGPLWGDRELFMCLLDGAYRYDLVHWMGRILTLSQDAAHQTVW